MKSSSELKAEHVLFAAKMSKRYGDDISKRSERNFEKAKSQSVPIYGKADIACIDEAIIAKGYREIEEDSETASST